MQNLSCDEVWFRDVCPGLACLIGFRSNDRSSVHVLFSQNFRDLNSLAETNSQLATNLPGGLDIIGIGLVDLDLSVSHATIQKSLTCLDEPAILLQWTKSNASKRIVRVMDNGLLKPFSGTVNIKSVPIRNVLMKLPVDIRLPPVPSATLVDKWFEESVTFTTLDPIDGTSNISFQRAVVRTTDYQRPTAEDKRVRGLLTLASVIQPHSDPSGAIRQSLLRRLQSPNRQVPHALYVAGDSCSEAILFSVTSRDSLNGLEWWKNEINAPKTDFRTKRKLLSHVHIIIALVALLSMYIIYRI